MGELIIGNFGRPNPVLSKKQFAAHPQIRRSHRWVEQQVRKGMPSIKEGHRRMFPFDDCLRWLMDRGLIGHDRGGGHAKAG